MAHPVPVGLEVDQEVGPAGEETRFSPPESHQLRRLFQRGGFMKLGFR